MIARITKCSYGILIIEYRAVSLFNVFDITIPRQSKMCNPQGYGYGYASGEGMGISLGPGLSMYVSRHPRIYPVTSCVSKMRWTIGISLSILYTVISPVWCFSRRGW